MREEGRGRMGVVRVVIELWERGIGCHLKGCRDKGGFFEGDIRYF